MAIDDAPEYYVSSLCFNYREIKQNGDAPSAEDVAWADSCLNINSLSQSGWESLRDALLEDLDSQSVPLKHNKPDIRSETDTEMIDLSKPTENAINFPDGADTEMISSTEETETSIYLDKAPDNDASLINDSNLGSENGDTFEPGFNLENVFLPTYNESHRNIGFSDCEYKSTFPAFAIDDQSPKDIFKVWELGSSVEDEELIYELHKTLSEKPLKPLPAVSDSRASDDSRELNNLISGIADISLVEVAV